MFISEMSKRQSHWKTWGNTRDTESGDKHRKVLGTIHIWKKHLKISGEGSCQDILSEMKDKLVHFSPSTMKKETLTLLGDKQTM